MLRVTRRFARKPPGFNHKLKNDPPPKVDYDYDGKKDGLEKTVYNLQEILKKELNFDKTFSTASKFDKNSKTTTETEENEWRTKKKTVTTTSDGKKYHNYEYTIDGNKFVQKYLGLVVGFCVGFYMFKDFLPGGEYDPEKPKTINNPYQDQVQVRAAELQYKNVNEMYEQRQKLSREQQLQADIDSYNAQDDKVEYKSWDGHSIVKGSPDGNQIVAQDQDFKSYRPSSKFDR